MSEILRSLSALRTRLTKTRTARAEAWRITQSTLDKQLDKWKKVGTPEIIKMKTTDSIVFHTKRLGGKPDWHKANKTAEKELKKRGVE